jgi:hypothetical protein
VGCSQPVQTISPASAAIANKNIRVFVLPKNLFLFIKNSSCQNSLSALAVLFLNANGVSMRAA